MVVSRAKPGATRQQLIERLTRDMHPETWDLVRHGALSHILYRVEGEPGVFAVLQAPSIEDASKLIGQVAQRAEVFDFDVVPVNHFPHFD
jgi:hypothetical protein